VRFGIGSNASAKQVEIQWPSGQKQVFQDVKADQILNAHEP
jgi:hypothetical protein